jgi:putative transcriptional regulator
MSRCLISNNIRKLRFYTHEMTQQELADRTGVTRQTIIAIENGKYSPTLDLAFRIARVFNTQLEEVFSYMPEQNPDKE